MTTIMSNGKGHFGHSSRTVQSVPPSKVLSNILAKPNKDGLFCLLFNQNFRNLGLNKKAPLDSDFANVFCINAIYHEYSFSQYIPGINKVLSVEYNSRRRGVQDSTVWMILKCTRKGVPHGVGQTGMNCFCIN